MVNRKIRVVTMKSLGYRWRTSQISFEFDFVIRVVYKMIFSIIAKSSESDFLDWNHFVGYVYISIYHLKYVYIPNIRFIRVHVPHLCGTFPIGSGIQKPHAHPFLIPGRNLGKIDCSLRRRWWPIFILLWGFTTAGNPVSPYPSTVLLQAWI